MTHLQQLTSLFCRRLSNVFMLFGLALLLLGSGVQVTRVARLRADSQARVAPAFEASLPALLPAAVSLVTATPAPADPPERLVIPSIGLDTAVVTVGWEARVVNGQHQGNVWQTARFAAGYHQGSAPPGQVGNTVISGHNNIDGAVFKDLHAVEPFAWIYLFAGGRRHAYMVEESFIIPEVKASEKQRLDNVKWISDTPDERLTLITCYPPWSNTHRTIVLARPVRDPAQVPADAPAP